MNQNKFKQVGNLAFYDGWSPDYVYFKTLLNAGEYYATSRGPSQYNPELAESIASQARADAKSKAIFGNTQLEHETYFQEKLNQIINFLEKAIVYERANEQAYFSQLKENYYKRFPEAKNSEKLQEIFKIIDENKKGAFPYKKFIAAINILQSDLNNAKTIFNYEAKRITQIDSLVNKALDSRESQTRGLLSSRHNKTFKEIEEGAKQSRERLRHKITVEYATTGQLTRKVNNRFVLYGAAQIEREVPQAIDRVLANWVEEVMNQIIDEQDFLDAIIAKMNISYPYNGDFKQLEHEVQQRIVLAIAQIGTQNLSTVINKEINQNLIKKIVGKVSDDNPFLDMSQTIKIDGLDKNNFGLAISDTKLFKGATTIDELLSGSGKELFSRIEATLSTMDKKGVTLLSDVLDNTTTTISTTAGTLSQSAGSVIDEIVKSIQTIVNIKEEADQFLKEYQDSLKHETSKVVSLEKNSSISSAITFKIEGKTVSIEGFEELQKQLGGTVGFQALGFKKFNPQDITSMITTLKRQASIKLKTIIANSISQYLNSALNRFSESKLISIIGKETSRVAVKMNGPTLAELLPGLQLVTSGNNYYFDWNNYKGKNDSVTIAINRTALKKELTSGISQTLDTKDIIEKIEKGLDGELGEARNKFLAAIQHELNKRIQTATQNGKENKYSEIATDYLTIIDHIDEQSEEIQKAYQKFLRQIRKWLKKATTLNHEERIAVAKVLRESINDSFYISNTTKSANDYANFLGVKGGTLGNAGFSTQFARIQDIFSNAGLPIEPELAEWMQSAIINCFHGSMVDEKNKPLIEQYLGALMAFALFDEGGAEGQIINNVEQAMFQEINSEKNTSSKNFLHLYLIDSIYYPGSFVLQRTLNELKGTVMQNLQQVNEISRTGAGILIVNPASTKLIGNRPISQQSNPDPNVWTTTGEAVKSGITLQILFLAGLMDIVRSINNALSKVTI